MRWFSPPLVLILSGLFCSTVAQRPSPSPVPNPPKPGFTVVLQRQTVREDDELQAKIWISNEWDKPISDVVLRVNTPAFLTWNASSCAEWKINGYKADAEGVANIGTIAANDFREVTVCLKSGSDILVGEFHVSFTCEYAWPLANGKGRSFVTTEKTVKSNLLGSDSVAGVPIALASFIVPGLFFWMALGWLKVPWNVGSALGEKLVYSVIVSILLLWITNWWGQDLSGGIGLSKLLYFALAGGAVGFVVGGVDRGLRYVAKRSKEKKALAAAAAEPKLGESSQDLLRKLLSFNPNCKNPQAVVRLEDGTQYIGSLMRQTSDIVAVVGWFRIVKENISAPNREQIIAALEQAPRPLDVFNLADRYGLKIEPRNGIRMKTADADVEDEIDERLTIQREGVAAQQHCGTAEDDVLIVE